MFIASLVWGNRRLCGRPLPKPWVLNIALQQLARRYDTSHHWSYNISRHPWPWAKTQESGFSHCALMAKDKCQWMMYTDVDEFVFSPSWMKQNIEYPLMNITYPKAVLRQLVTNLSTVGKPGAAMTGQISLRCRNFGPSGLHEHPQKGVTEGYTCRERQ